LPKFTVIDVYL